MSLEEHIWSVEDARALLHFSDSLSFSYGLLLACGYVSVFTQQVFVLDAYHVPKWVII